MTLEEFRKKAAENEEWAPGWDAIDDAFDKIYPGVNPTHYATDLVRRTMFGGDQFLDGYSFFPSPKGYWHLVTYGMTFLYMEEEELGEEWNKWGYEMTMKLKEDDIQNCLYAADFLSNIARYTYNTGNYFEPYHFINCNGPIWISYDTQITAALAVADTEVEGVDTIYGRTDFIQFVGITSEEFEMLREDPSKAAELAERLKADYPDLETDLHRTKSYVF